jgi:hypothetical protein
MIELVASGIEVQRPWVGSDDIDAGVLMMGTCDFELQTEEVFDVVMVMMFG